VSPGYEGIPCPLGDLLNAVKDVGWEDHNTAELRFYDLGLRVSKEFQVSSLIVLVEEDRGGELAGGGVVVSDVNVPVVVISHLISGTLNMLDEGVPCHMQGHDVEVGHSLDHAIEDPLVVRISMDPADRASSDRGVPGTYLSLLPLEV